MAFFDHEQNVFARFGHSVEEDDPVICYRGCQLHIEARFWHLDEGQEHVICDECEQVYTPSELVRVFMDYG